MGNIVTMIQRAIGAIPDDKRVLLLGLDAAGKTTILYQLKLGETQSTIPTIGFNVETVQYKKTNFTMWDVGGQQRIRPLWRHYTANTDVLIYVVDSADKERIEESAEELQALLADDGLRNAAILVFANKADLKGSMDVKTIAKHLQLDKDKKRQWFVQPAIANRGEGLYEGLDWMNGALKKQANKA